LASIGRRSPISSPLPATRSTRSRWRSKPDHCRRHEKRRPRAAFCFAAGKGYMFG
jgi:hypothetical protein